VERDTIMPVEPTTYLDRGRMDVRLKRATIPFAVATAENSRGRRDVLPQPATIPFAVATDNSRGTMDVIAQPVPTSLAADTANNHGRMEVVANNHGRAVGDVVGDTTPAGLTAAQRGKHSVLVTVGVVANTVSQANSQMGPNLGSTASWRLK